MNDEALELYGTSINELLDETLLEMLQIKRQAMKPDADEDTKQAWKLTKAILQVEDRPDNYAEQSQFLNALKQLGGVLGEDDE